jgi:CHAD domain-containing protein
MEIDRIEKPLRQLRKSLKGFPKDPPPDEVHKLRTRSRRIEAVAAALEPADGKITRRLLKSIKPVRKAAGGVRDMDVLTADALDLSHGQNEEALIRLVEHLSNLRQANAGELLDTVKRQSKPARRRLKKYEKLVEAVFSGKKSAPLAVSRTVVSENGQDPVTAALVNELSHWPRLSERNVHAFRLKVKELRYVLQLYPQPDSGLVDALGKVKDRIGEWHDWLQLEQIAAGVLDPQQDGALLGRIEKTTRQKLAAALTASNALRRKHFPSAPLRKKPN